MDLKGIKLRPVISSVIWYASEMAFVARLEATEANSVKISLLLFVLDYQNRLHEARFWPWPSNHCCCIPSPLRYDIRRWIDGEFRGFSAYCVGSVPIRMLVEFVVRNFWQSDQNAGDGVGPAQIIITAREAYQTTSLDILRRLACSWHSNSGAVVYGKAIRLWKYLCSGAFWWSSGKKKSWNGHRLATVTRTSQGELSSSPRYYIRSPIDEKFRGFSCSRAASKTTSMLAEVGGGNYSTKFLTLNDGPERPAMPKNVAKGHQTSIWHSGNGLMLKSCVYLPFWG